MSPGDGTYTFPDTGEPGLLIRQNLLSFLECGITETQIADITINQVATICWVWYKCFIFQILLKLLMTYKLGSITILDFQRENRLSQPEVSCMDTGLGYSVQSGFRFS